MLQSAFLAGSFPPPHSLRATLAVFVTSCNPLAFDARCGAAANYLPSRPHPMKRRRTLSAVFREVHEVGPCIGRVAVGARHDLTGRIIAEVQGAIMAGAVEIVD